MGNNSSWQYWSIFIRLAVVASQKCELAQNSVKICTYSSSRSSKVDDSAINRKRICDFLLVTNIVILVLSSTISEIRRLIGWKMKIAYFPPVILLFGAPALCSLWNFAMKLTTRKLESWVYLWWKLHDPITSTVFDWSTHVTDRLTDGRAIAYDIARYSIYAVARYKELA